MKVLVIGGTRCTGPRLVEELVEREHEVIVFHRGQSEELPLPSNVRHIHGNRRNRREFQRQMESLDVDAVVDMIPYEVEDSKQVVECFRGRVQRSVHISSYEIYVAYQAMMRFETSMQPVPIPEDAPKREALDLYGEGLRYEETDRTVRYDKLLCEKVIMEASEQGDLPAAILRWPAVYGPGHPRLREWHWVKRILDGRKRIAIPGDGLSLMHRGHARNLAHGIVLALENPHSQGEVYNAADGFVLSVRQITDLIAEILNHEWEVVSVPMQLMHMTEPTQTLPHSLNPYGVAPHLVMDLTKIKAALGYEDIVGPEEGMREAVEWLREHPQSNGFNFDYALEDRLIEKTKSLLQNA